MYERKDWTKGEIEFVRQNANKLDDKKLAEALGRKERSVKNYRQRHGILQSPAFRGRIMSLALGGNGTTMSSADYRRRYPLRAKAQDIVRARIQSGKLIKQPCKMCGSVGRVEAHHDDYSKPLEVRWLCCQHHQAIRRSIKNHVQ